MPADSEGGVKYYDEALLDAPFISGASLHL